MLYKSFAVVKYLFEFVTHQQLRLRKAFMYGYILFRIAMAMAMISASISPNLNRTGCSAEKIFPFSPVLRTKPNGCRFAQSRFHVLNASSML